MSCLSPSDCVRICELRLYFRPGILVCLFENAKFTIAVFLQWWGANVYVGTASKAAEGGCNFTVLFLLSVQKDLPNPSNNSGEHKFIKWFSFWPCFFSVSLCLPACFFAGSKTFLTKIDIFLIKTALFLSLFFSQFPSWRSWHRDMACQVASVTLF